MRRKSAFAFGCGSALSLGGQPVLKIGAAFLVATLLMVCLARPAGAQNPNGLMPAESAARAKSILDQAIAALGGPAYLGLRDSDCTARFAGFERSGEIGGLGEVRVLRQLPDKNRTEYDKRGDIVTVYAGDKGWTLDRSGVEELSAEDIAAYQEQLKNDAHFILRYRLNEPGLVLRYGGTEVVDLKQVDWVEVADSAGRNVRIAVDRSSHFPVRFVVSARDSDGARTEAVTVYSNYRPISGIQTAFQVSRFRNGLQVSQVFYSACKYNTSLPDDLFSRVSLDKHFTGK
jgi:outer membrane lipoprotein-sorting protein